jgi:hypothetical protein
MSVATLTVSETRLMHARSQLRSDCSHCCDRRSYSGPESLAAGGTIFSSAANAASSRERRFEKLPIRDFFLKGRQWVLPRLPAALWVERLCTNTSVYQGCASSDREDAGRVHGRCGRF